MIPTKVKKEVKKKRMDITSAEGEQCFWCHDGNVLSSLLDLKDALSRMSKETYGHHVTKEKNDFAVWAEWTLCDKKCADALRKVKTQKGAISQIEKHLAL